VIDASNDGMDSFDWEELAKIFALNNDSEDKDSKVLVLIPMHYFSFLLNVKTTYILNKL
jgi:hypothetical protein